MCVVWGKLQLIPLGFFLSQFHLNMGVYLKVQQPTTSVAIRYKIVGKGSRRGCNWHWRVWRHVKYAGIQSKQ
uniref:Putative secreted protein n=1 Tax=Anopheles darlingi TaxID=43151 RepID=A0A2M4DBM8_ANODA